MSEPRKPRLRRILLADIYVDDSFNCRAKFNHQSVATLADSISAIGLQMPIEVHPCTKKMAAETGKKWQIICGHRRLLACEMLRLKDIAALAHYRRLEDSEAALRNFSENVERFDLSIMDEARWLDRMFPAGTKTIREIMKIIGKDTKWVHRRQKLLKASPEVQTAAEAGRLSEHRLDAILLFESHEDQNLCLNRLLKINEQCISVGAETLDRIEHGKPNRKGIGRALPTQKDCIELIAILLDASVIGIGPRILAWVAGWITKEELLKDISRITPISKIEPKHDQGYPAYCDDEAEGE